MFPFGTDTLGREAGRVSDHPRRVQGERAVLPQRALGRTAGSRALTGSVDVDRLIRHEDLEGGTRRLFLPALLSGRARVEVPVVDYHPLLLALCQVESLLDLLRRCRTPR